MLVPEISVEEIAAELRTIKSNDEKVILFLGSRAGRLFGNAKLYAALKPYSFRDFDRLPDECTKFGECYRILADHKHFYERHIYDVLAPLLKDMPVRKEDQLLGELLQDGFFASIMSTDMDDGLERAFSTMDMKPKQDFHVYAPPFGVTEDGSIRSLLEQNIQFPALIKIFGDLESRRYKTVYDNFQFESEPELVKRLADLLSAHVLLIGYDAYWDQLLNKIFPLKGGHFWHVNEDPPPEHSPLFHSWKSRDGKWCPGVKTQQSQSFIRHLYRTLRQTTTDGRRTTIPLAMDGSGAALIERKTSIPQPVHVSLPTTPIVKEKRTHIFISYSHRDATYMKELSEHLSFLKDGGILDFWSDERIKVGAKWREEITKALQGTRVAVLLVSKHFLNSRFINEVELPHLLEAAKSEGVTIFPVLVSMCLFKNSELSKFQFVDTSGPLKGKKEHTRDREWVKIAGLIQEAYSRDLSGSASF